jgi:DNA-binding XRE family transcriptional regulator
VTSQEQAVAKQIASLIRSARKSKGLTQISVAEHLGISQSALSKIESGILIPSAPQWFSFCQLTSISPECLTAGYIDRHTVAHLDSNLHNLPFKLPRRYSHHRGAKVRALLPIMDFTRAAWGQARFAEFLEAQKVDSDMFVDLDNQINLNFFLDLSRSLLLHGTLKPEEADRGSRCVMEPKCHGEIHSEYDRQEGMFNRLATLLQNSKYYECNFIYGIEEQKAGSLTMSMKPAEHLKEFSYKDDEVLGDFLCRYYKGYFQNFTRYAGGKGATLTEVDCHYHGAERCVYELKAAG